MTGITLYGRSVGPFVGQHVLNLLSSPGIPSHTSRKELTVIDIFADQPWKTVSISVPIWSHEHLVRLIRVLEITRSCAIKGTSQLV